MKILNFNINPTQNLKFKCKIHKSIKKNQKLESKNNNYISNCHSTQIPRKDLHFIYHC